MIQRISAVCAPAGTSNFFSANDSLTGGGNYWALWLFGWTFSNTAATVMSGAVAERTQFRCVCPRHP